MRPIWTDRRKTGRVETSGRVGETLHASILRGNQSFLAVHARSRRGSRGAQKRKGRNQRCRLRVRDAGRMRRLPPLRRRRNASSSVRAIGKLRACFYRIPLRRGTPPPPAAAAGASSLPFVFPVRRNRANLVPMYTVPRAGLESKLMAALDGLLLLLPGFGACEVADLSGRFFHPRASSRIAGLGCPALFFPRPRELQACAARAFTASACRHALGRTTFPEKRLAAPTCDGNE